MKSILISGASRGIGRKVAERMVKDGHKISLGLRDLSQLDGTSLDPNIKRNNNNVLASHYESEDKESATQWVENTKKSFGKIDAIIHCAGQFNKIKVNFKDHEEEEIRKLWEVNVMGPWLLTRAAWKYLIENKESRIVALASMSGKRSKSTLASYTTTKFALMGLCQTIKNEGWGEGVRVTAICPGWVNTDMSKGVKLIPRKDMTQTEDIASLISTIILLPNSCVPFELCINCNLEA